jgi:NitT/TauT family transport system ATP-binding protein
VPLSFQDLCFAWPDGTPAVADLSLDLPPGGVHALVGPSGCGKSTLLRLAAGLLTPSQGAIHVPAGPKGFVFQAPTLLPWRTVRANVALPLELGDARGDVDAALEQVGLSEHADKLPAQLSGGMQMRVSLARALLAEPRLVLLDEAFGSLDALTRKRLQMDTLALWRRSGFTALLVTHDIDEAVLLADTISVFAGPPLRLVAHKDVPLERPRTRAHAHDPRLAELSQTIEGLL